MDRAFSMHGDEKIIQNVGKPEGKNHSEDLSVDGRIILKWILSKQSGSYGLDSCQDRDRQRTFVNTLMSLRVP
jgi:hypothetical protein